MDDFDNIDVGGGWNPADISTYFDDSFWSDIGDIDVKYGSIDVPDLSTLPEADYSNEGRNYPTPESTQGPGGSPINSSVSGDGANLRGLFDKLLRNSKGDLDYAKILPLIYGLYGATQSNQRTQPSGYQGGIPRYTATRQAPEPGKRISGNVLFSKPDGAVVNPNSAAAPTAVAVPSGRGGLVDALRRQQIETGGIASEDESKRQAYIAPPYANDPEYIRLRDAATRARGDSMTMDVKPEEQALRAYERSKMGGMRPPARDERLMSDMIRAVNAPGTPRPYDAPEANMRPVEGPAPEYMAQGGTLRAGGFIIPADVVSHFGNGSSDAGLKALASKLGATPIKGAGDGMSDSIPTSIDGKEKALVAHEEAYLSPEKVARIGNGDQAKGAKKLRDMMERIRKARTGTAEQGRQIDPSKFMPGGEVKRYQTGGATGVGTAAAAGVTGTEESLANWAGPYVTDMLAKGQALSEMPFEQYGGPLTAGTSNLQNKVFTGLQGVNFPGNLGQSFSSATAPTIGADGQPGGPQGIAASYMNPYLSAVLNPQLEEMRRQAQINQLQGLGAFTKSGAFGGGRQAIMESETARNLAQEQNKAIAQGYSNAYDKAMGQFNTEQQQAKTLADLMSQQGAVQRGIESEQVAADKAQFEEARLNPYKMVQFQQSLLSGLPLAATTYNQAPTNNLTQFAGNLTTLQKALASLGITPGG